MSEVSPEILHRKTLAMSKIVISVAFSLLLFGIAVYICIGVSGTSSFAYLFPVLPAIVGAYIILNLLYTPNIIITKENLVLHYPYIFRKRVILWTAITDAEMTYFDANYDKSLNRKGKVVTLFANNKKHSIIIFRTAEDEKLLYQINKHLGGRFKAKMKHGYKKSTEENEQNEAAFRNFLFKVVLPLFILWFIALWVWNKYFV